MPLRDDLLTPIAGDNPSGANLYYDKVFDTLKEARQEDDESVPTGDWGRAPKRADRNLIIKLAGETIATRSKDLRLAGWYIESLIRKEGFAQLVPSLEFLRGLQSAFWETLHPELDEDGMADLRIGAVESAAALVATQLRRLPLTRSGIDWLGYQDARAIGFETEGMNDDKAAARADAVARGRLTGEDLKQAIDSTPKAFYAGLEADLARSLEALEALDRYNEERYGDDYPSLGKLKSAIDDVGKVVASILVEKRRLEPDEPGDVPEDTPADDAVVDNDAEPAASVSYAAPVAKAVPRPKPVLTGAPTDSDTAFAQVAACAEFLRTQDPSSPTPYLLCSGLRFGEMRALNGDPSAAAAPSTETRQTLRRLLSDCDWDGLMPLALAMLAEPCGRAWLDVHRYIYRTADANGWHALRSAVLANVRGMLQDLPNLRSATLDDDTPAANTETLQWIDSDVLPPAVSSPMVVEETMKETYMHVSSEETLLSGEMIAETAAAPELGVYETAVATLRQGRALDAVMLLERDAATQPSGRMRFQRRVQVAEICLLADQPAIALPLLNELADEALRRGLETWESAELLAQPLSLLLRAMDNRKANAEERDEVFARLCRLHPQAALGMRR